MTFLRDAEFTQAAASVPAPSHLRLVPQISLSRGHGGGLGWGRAPTPHAIPRPVKAEKDDGFTLVELLVVLAIIGLSLAIAVPVLWRHAGGGALNAAASEIRSVLRGARSTAIAEDRPVVFRGDPRGGYWLDRYHFTLPLMTGAPSLRVATMGAGQISFFPSGGSSGGRVLVVSGDSRREIAVDALTGRADER